MSNFGKFLVGAFSLIFLGVGAFFVLNYFGDPVKKDPLNPDSIASDYGDLLAEAERLKSSTGSACTDKKGVNRQIDSLEKKLLALGERKKGWLESVPQLPEFNPEVVDEVSPSIRPGSEMPTLEPDNSHIPPLPELSPDSIIVEEAPGSQVPELTSDVPPLPEIEIEGEYIPELPEINTGRPGSELPELTSDAPPLPELSPDSIVVEEVPGSQVPELTSDVPPLPEIDDLDIINPDENIFQMEDKEKKIMNILQELRDLCREESSPAKKISDKCSDACQRYKDCAAYTEDVTPADLSDAYDTCMEECAAWPKDMIKCINAIEIKKPNDCVGFLNCRLPKYYEEKYQ